MIRRCIECQKFIVTKDKERTKCVECKRKYKPVERKVRREGYRHMKKIILILLLLFSQSTAHALIVPVSQNTFQDNQTGYVWRRIDSFFGMSYNEMISNLGPNFYISNETELMQMHDSMQGMSFNSVFDIIGGSTNQFISPHLNAPMTDEYMLGIYESTDGFGTASRNQWNDGEIDTGWNYYQRDWNNFDKNVKRDSLGLWASDRGFSSIHNPEPATMLMMFGGLAGAWRMRRKHGQL